MKKIVVTIGILLLALIIIGCTPNDSERKDIINVLSKAKLISGTKYKEIDSEEVKFYSGWSCDVHEYFIYEDSSGDRIAVTFDKKDNSDNDQYDVVVYTSVIEETDLDYYDEKPEGCPEEHVYKTKNDDYTKNPKYIIDNPKNYTIVKEGKKFTIKNQVEK